MDVTNHSMKMVKYMIDYFTTMTLELNTAYVMLDHQILFKKMESFGIQGGEISLFKGYYSQRNSYLQIDIKQIKIIDLGPYGVVQQLTPVKSPTK